MCKACRTKRALVMAERLDQQQRAPGLLEKGRLEQTLRVLVGDAGISHGRSADAELAATIRDRPGANGDVECRAAVGGEMADSPTVDAASTRFQRMDDFHGFCLWRSRDGSRVFQRMATLTRSLPAAWLPNPIGRKRTRSLTAGRFLTRHGSVQLIATELGTAAAFPASSKMSTELNLFRFTASLTSAYRKPCVHAHRRQFC